MKYYYVNIENIYLLLYKNKAYLQINVRRIDCIQCFQIQYDYNTHALVGLRLTHSASQHVILLHIINIIGFGL